MVVVGEGHTKAAPKFDIMSRALSQIFQPGWHKSAAVQPVPEGFGEEFPDTEQDLVRTE
jgi:hypothetical protein